MFAALFSENTGILGYIDDEKQSASRVTGCGVHAGFPDFYKKYLNADLENPELREEILDYFIDKIYVDDDGNLLFVIKRYGKDGTKLVEMSAEELIENQGFTVFDNFALCSTLLKVLIF